MCGISILLICNCGSGGVVDEYRNVVDEMRSRKLALNLIDLSSGFILPRNFVARFVGISIVHFCEIIFEFKEQLLH
jgi:pentatricopeptide repeat protein